jgi:hypothetical protein
MCFICWNRCFHLNLRTINQCSSFPNLTLPQKKINKEDSFSTYVGVTKDQPAAAAAASASGKNVCSVCSKAVYMTEQLVADNKTYHKNCFRFVYSLTLMLMLMLTLTLTQLTCTHMHSHALTQHSYSSHLT